MTLNWHQIVLSSNQFLISNFSNSSEELIFTFITRNFNNFTKTDSCKTFCISHSANQGNREHRVKTEKQDGEDGDQRWSKTRPAEGIRGSGRRSLRDQARLPQTTSNHHRRNMFTTPQTNCGSQKRPFKGLDTLLVVDPLIPGLCSHSESLFNNNNKET